MEIQLAILTGLVAFWGVMIYIRLGDIADAIKQGEQPTSYGSLWNSTRRR